jgi:hypothetical protein
MPLAIYLFDTYSDLVVNILFIFIICWYGHNLKRKLYLFMFYIIIFNIKHE